jgi:hypothetical protein
MNTSHYLVSLFVMLLYSAPAWLLLGLVGHWLAGAAGAMLAVAGVIAALFLALSPKPRLTAS